MPRSDWLAALTCAVPLSRTRETGLREDGSLRGPYPVAGAMSKHQLVAGGVPGMVQDK